LLVAVAASTSLALPPPVTNANASIAHFALQRIRSKVRARREHERFASRPRDVSAEPRVRADSPPCAGSRWVGSLLCRSFLVSRATSLECEHGSAATARNAAIHGAFDADQSRVPWSID
jgi:hypothetical protein